MDSYLDCNDDVCRWLVVEEIYQGAYFKDEAVSNKDEDRGVDIHVMCIMER